MRKTAIATLCIFSLLALTACRKSAAESPKPSLKTDDEVRAAYKEATGDELEEDWGCIGRPESFPHVVLIGAFANDRGCMKLGMFVEGTWKGDWNDAIPKALAIGGWTKGDEAKRKALAKAWLEEAEFLWGGSPVTSTEKAFELSDTPDFEPPTYTASKEGGIVATMWFQEPAGMIDQRSFSKASFTFAKDGQLAHKEVGGFVVPGEALRGNP